MKYYLVFILLTITFNSRAQTDTTKTNTNAVYSFVAVMPEPDYNFDKYLSKKLRYPKNAREEGIQGRVIVNFVVNEDGSISDIKIAKGIGGGCDEEAIHLLANMPNWKPGKNEGKPVKVMITKGITFRLM